MISYNVAADLGLDFVSWNCWSVVLYNVRGAAPTSATHVYNT